MQIKAVSFSFAVIYFSDCFRLIGKGKYENVQKGVGDMMRGALIETEARRILNQGISQGKNDTK